MATGSILQIPGKAKFTGLADCFLLGESEVFEVPETQKFWTAVPLQHETRAKWFPRTRWKG
ncbi:MAG: hypothetical protein J4F49_09670 [Rhodobacteraceae bacterium]|nr:hypothetical protein [Paracoccaceae bacterium]